MTPVTRSRLIIVTLAAAVLLFFLRLFGALEVPERRLMRALSGVEASLASSGRSLRLAISNPFRVGDIADENDELRGRMAGLESEIARLRQLEGELEELRGLAGFADRTDFRLSHARVLSRTPEAGTHTILIDRGSDDGVTPGMPVVAGSGVIVGKILKAEPAVSHALLLTDGRSRVGASTLNAVRTQGVAQGERGLSLEMRLIPQNEEIAVGDVVVTSGIETLVPKGLVIGAVTELQTQEKNPFKTASLEPPLRYDTLEVVAVLIR